MLVYAIVKKVLILGADFIVQYQHPASPLQICILSSYLTKRARNYACMSDDDELFFQCLDYMA